MILIAESGATKTDWVFGDCKVRTKGINLAVMSDNDIETMVTEALSAIEGSAKAQAVFFYGAGLVSDASIDRLHTIFARHFRYARMEFASDLMAAARALWADKPGTVAILGSGSNSCSYDGHRIVRNVRPGGYILGDEGGGVSIGRRFIADYIKNLVPEALASEFSDEYRLTYEKIVESVYKGRNPAGFLASFAPFVVSRVNKCEYARDLVTENFRSFITRSLLSYGQGGIAVADGIAVAENGGDVLEVGVSGTLGFTCRSILEGLGKEYGISFVKFLDSPIKVLPSYHKNYNFALSHR